MKKVALFLSFVLICLLFSGCGGNTIIGTWLGDASFISEDGAETIDYYYYFYEDGTGKCGNDTLGFSEFTYTKEGDRIIMDVDGKEVNMTYAFVDEYTVTFTARGTSAEFKRVE